jgi:hypothetical protein
LSLHCILGCAIKALDSEVLLDPFEEELYLPPAFVQLSNGKWWKGEVVRQESEIVLSLYIEISNAAKLLRVVFRRVKACENNCLVALEAGRFVDRMGIQPAKPEIAFGTSDIKCRA